MLQKSLCAVGIRFWSACEIWSGRSPSLLKVYLIRGGAYAADLFSGASSDLRFSPGPSRTPSQDRSKIRMRSNSESPRHGGIFEALLESQEPSKFAS